MVWWEVFPRWYCLAMNPAVSRSLIPSLTVSRDIFSIVAIFLCPGHAFCVAVSVISKRYVDKKRPLWQIALEKRVEPRTKYLIVAIVACQSHSRARSCGLPEEIKTRPDPRDSV